MNPYHDWTFIGLSVDWQLGQAVFRLRDVMSEDRILKVNGLATLNFSRLLPWGPSVSINEIVLGQIENSGVLRIEMQSGDLIECVGDSFEL